MTPPTTRRTRADFGRTLPEHRPTQGKYQPAGSKLFAPPGKTSAVAGVLTKGASDSSEVLRPRGRCATGLRIEELSDAACRLRAVLPDARSCTPGKVRLSCHQRHVADHGKRRVEGTRR